MEADPALAARAERWRALRQQRADLPLRPGIDPKDLETRLFDVLPDETWVYPGHGNDTTIGTERPHLSEWRERGW